MGILDGNIPVLYSVGTDLAYKISKRYYDNTHYVWCTTKFNSSVQPPTSNPQTICRRFLEQIKTGDRHAFEIDKNKSGILSGAHIKKKEGVITEEQFKEIRDIVSKAEYESFFPVIYIIYTDKVQHKCIEVEKFQCASDNSVEYRIEKLEAGEFDAILIKDMLHGIIEVVERKAGD